MAFEKTLFFDLGNVLLFFSLPQMLEQIAAVTHLPATQINKELRETGLFEDYERGAVSSQNLFDHFSKIADQPFLYDDLLEAASNIFIPHYEMIPLLNTLKEKKHQLLLLSNTNEAHFAYATKHYPEIFAPFDDFILSYKVGAIKPEPKIFQTALAKARVPAKECFYTDDIPEFIEAASRVDIPGMVFTGIDPLIEQLRSRDYL